jgi:Flp pilus assembly protein TadG
MMRPMVSSLLLLKLMRFTAGGMGKTMKRIFTKFSVEALSSKLSLRPRRRQRGSIMLLTAVTLTVMLGMLALSIDLGFAFSSRGQLQNGIDSAALAAAAAMRLTIEGTEAAPHETALAENLAIQYAGFNQVRRYVDPNPQGTPQPNANQIVISASNVQVQKNFDLPRVRVDVSLPIPTLFAGLFGLNGFTVSAAATGTIFPVDGGTGSIGIGPAVGGGCWNPVMIPDSYFDQGNNVHWVGDPARGEAAEWPNQPGDYYRSRYAAGARNVFPYIDSTVGAMGPYVTGVRDTRTLAEISDNKSLMGRVIEIKALHYRVADLSGLPQVSAVQYSISDLARYGYCGQIRVGADLPVYTPGDESYDKVRRGLQALKANVNDILDTEAMGYRYIKSSSYPSPNTHGAIIPVLMFNPVEVNRNPGLTALKVTNIGLFFLEEIRNDGTIRGFFVREIISAGTPIDPSNMTTDSEPTFKQSWLPMAVRLVK